MSASSRLHLPSLTITGFRGIDDLTIPRLGRVTLLVGRNGVGKTAALEAAQIYAARGRPAVLREILARHDETLLVNGGEIDWSALFHRDDGREESRADCISIGPAGSGDQLRIERGASADRELIASIAVSPPSESDHAQLVGQRSLSDVESPVPLPCEFVGPAPFDDHELAQLWDAAVARGCETQAVDALRLIAGDTVEGVAVIGGAIGESPSRGALVCVEGGAGRRPLKSLGGGAVRLFGVALALVRSSGGLLLIDGAEGETHHSMQRAFWHMVLQTAQERNVQVIATTHSWDCVTGFALAAAELEDIDGLLYRLSDARGPLCAVEYTEEGLVVAAEQGIEMR